VFAQRDRHSQIRERDLSLFASTPCGVGPLAMLSAVDADAGRPGQDLRQLHELQGDSNMTLDPKTLAAVDVWRVEHTPNLEPVRSSKQADFKRKLYSVADEVCSTGIAFCPKGYICEGKQRGCEEEAIEVPQNWIVASGRPKLPASSRLWTSVEYGHDVRSL